MNNQVELLYRILCDPTLRAVGHTTALVEGLKFVGGGTIVMSSMMSAQQERRVEKDIEFVSITNLNKFIDKGFTKPLFLDPHTLKYLLADVLAKNTNAKEELTKLVEMVGKSYISSETATDMIPDILAGKTIDYLLSQKGV